MTDSGRIEGIYFDGHSSKQRRASLQLGPEAELQLQVFPRTDERESETSLHSQQVWKAQQVKIEPPLARVRRVLKFPDGGRFETNNDAAISALEQQLGRNVALGGVRRIEARWGATLAALVGIVVFGWAFLTFGLPALAFQAARVTPASVLASFDDEAIKMLDDGSYMGPSQLSRARQAQLQRQFREVKDWAGGGYPYRLLLRDGEPGGNGFSIGANAFALPNGTIVMTDQLVALAKNDRELMGVLAHETGHVTHRHSLSSVYQGIGIAALTTAVTGDLVSAGTFAAALPTTLLTKGYSRQAETQADEVAGAYMMQHYGSTKPLRDMLARLETDDESADENDIKAKDEASDFLQTHPGTSKRIVHLRQIEDKAVANGTAVPTK